MSDPPGDILAGGSHRQERKPKPWLALLAFAVVVAALIAGMLIVPRNMKGAIAGELVVTDHSFTVAGILSVAQDQSATYLYHFEGDCVLSDGYADITTGAQVVVYDDAGKALSVGTLGPPSSAGDVCLFSFTVAHIPPGRLLYEVRIAGREGPKYSEQQMRGVGGLELTLG